VRIYGVNRIATVISFDPTANDDSLFENGATDNCEFEHFGITGAGTATGKRGFTIDSSASAFTWRHMDFASLNDWCITIDSGQHCYIEDCRFGATHNATDTAIAVRSTTFLNRISVNNNRFYNNDRDIVFGGSSSAVSICENGFELTGSLLSVPQLSVNLQAASGFKIDNNYFEGVRTDPTKGVIELENSYSGSVDCNHMVGDSLGTTRSSIFVNCVGTTRGVRVNNNTFNEVLYYFIKSTASFVVEAHGNRYFDGGVQLATYQAVVPLMNGMANIDLDLPVTFTYDPPNIANGAGSTSSGQAMTGATFGDTIRVAAPYDQQGLTATAYVSAANTAVVRLENQTGGAINLGSGTWKLYRRAGNL
jgi:hypothetical protein